MKGPGRSRGATSAAGRAQKIPVTPESPAAPEGGARPPAVKGPRELPVLPIRHTVLFPFAMLPLNVGRERSVALLNEVMSGDRTIAVLAQKDEAVEDPGFSDLHEIGSVGTVLRMVRFPDERYSVLVQGVERVRLIRPVADQPFLKGRFESLAETADQSVETEALVKNVLEQFERVVSLVPAIPDEAVSAARNQSGPGQIADFIASLLELPSEDKQKLLETLDAKERLRALTGILGRELQVLEVGAQIRDQVKESIDQHQREFLLRQQMEAIRKELGEGDEGQREIEELKAKLEKAQLPPEVKKEADRELARLRTIPPQAAEYTVARTYLEWLADMPWAVLTEDDLDLAHARAVLDEDHHGLQTIKERILEYLVVRKFKSDARTPILCFVGPPGTGKTSLGRSIARALGRKFVRQSLGGVRDEAEIRGHRRTYIGALPGQVIRGIRRAGTRNPLFMLDEVDKLGTDFHGDPSSALLEVLDPEQNSTFTDHYLDVPFDLSQVLFITTANILDTIPPPLRDRMEVIRLVGYTDLEKLEIAKRHLIPKATRENGLESLQLGFTDDAILKVVREYTSEAGLRNLERELANLLRKTAKEVAEGKQPASTIGPERVRELLGPERFQNEQVKRIDSPGSALGLAWTPVGGEVLTVETAIMPGAHQLILTGQLGEVMRESAQAALTWVRAHADELKIPREFFERSDIHVHLPTGAIPKDGPSAGITLATAIAGLLTGRKARPDIAMTGEITLQGQVLKIGGLKEKVLGAARAGIKTVILPADNEGELEEVPVEGRSRMIFAPV
ncbi:MAG TPA: endopeptidase La [Terriglobales bacterium]|nr:endopeptidase La [Terriglobales bacterium]